MGGGGDGAVSPPSDTTSSDGLKVNVNIRCSNGSKFSVLVNLDSTVGSFKSILSHQSEVPADQQRLIYKGRILKDDQTLQSYGLEADHTVHLVRGSAPAASPTNPATAPNAGGPNTTSSNARSVGSNEGGAPGGGLGLESSIFPGLGFEGLGATGGLFGAGLPDFEQVQQQLTRNPNIMREIMNMPAIQNIMNNPDIMRNLIMNNPQMREIMDRNPELAHILNDPSTLRQTLETARNPELMREMMRNTDRAMSNIESSPEGFNMLRRMYETVQEPFLNATTMSGTAGNDGSNPFAALLGTGGNATNNATANTSTTTSDTANGSPSPNTNPLPNPWSPASKHEGILQSFNIRNSSAGGTQTNSTRSNPTPNASAQVPTGLAGLGLPNLEGMLGATPDAAGLNQLMQNPAISQMMQSVMSNPQYVNQILGLNPQLRGLLDSNPQLREMMQDPEFLRQLTSPDTMQQMFTMQQQLLSQLGRQPTLNPGQTGGGTGAANNTGLEMLMNMFGGLGAGSLAVPNRSDVPPEELYSTQLTQLQEMGFIDRQENIRALIATAGNIHAAVERLLGNSGQ
uniref:Ubiquitin domain-containing protein DSK2a-like n=1 Tax=Cucumis melo TaxID=3656 RepID=A0A9I9D5S3_CUCME